MDKQRFSTPLLFVVLLLVLLSGVGWQAIGKAAPLSASLDVPFFSQTALRNQTVSNGRAPTLGNSDLLLWEYGCGVASLAMVYRQYGVDTDVTRLNDALHASGGFVGGLLAWDKTDAFLQAGAPWVKGIERINTTRPQDFHARIAAALDNGEPVLAYLNGQHYIVITGKEGDSYRINDPWAVTAETGKNIALDKNLLAKGGFDSIRQLVFVSRQEYAPSNSVLVQAAIRDKYIASRGAQGPLGNPLQAEEPLTGGGVWQRFESGAIFAPANAKPTQLFGPLWDKFQAAGGMAELGLPRSDVYSYFVGPAVEWRADFADVSILWTEGDRSDRARLIDAANGVRADYFANPNLFGQPAYSRYEGDLLFDWRDGAPGQWVDVDNFSARYTQTFRVGGLGWRYNFVIDTDSGVRVMLDGKAIVDAWDQPGQTHKFNRNLWRGQHELVVEYRHTGGDAHLLFARSTWPATPVFAAESTVGSFEILPISVAASVPDLGTPIAQATATAAGVIATLTAEARITPTPDTAVTDTTRRNFEQWAAANGEPYRDVQVDTTESDGFFASVHVIAWFRPQREAPWEEREATAECRRVGGEWQCDERFAFASTRSELARRAQATATVVAQVTATAKAAAAATATVIASLPAVYDPARPYNVTNLVDLAPGEVMRLGRGVAIAVAYSPDNNILAVAGTLGIWLYRLDQPDNGHLISHTSWAWSVAWSPDGQFLASGSDDGTVQVWRTTDNDLVHTLKGHTNRVNNVAWSPDSQFLASGSEDGTVHIWRTADGDLVRTLEGHTGASWSPDGQFLASGSNDGTVWVWRSADGGLVRTLEGHTDSVNSVSWSPDGTMLASGSNDATVRVWRSADGRLIHTLEGHMSWVTSVAWSPDGTMLASGSYDRTVQLWRVTDGSRLRALEGHTNGVVSVAWSPDGFTLASGDGIVRLWAIADGHLLDTMSGYTSSINSVAWSPDGQTLASGATDNVVRLWRIVDGTILRTLEGHTATINSVAWSPDGQTLASGSVDRTVRLWRTMDGTILRILKGHMDVVTSVSWSPDGQTLASGSLDGSLHLWRVVDGTLMHILESHTGSVYSAVWSPDGQALAVATDGSIHLWRLTDGTLLNTLDDHKYRITSLAWSPDGLILASGSVDKTVHLWSVTSGTHLSTLNSNAGYVFSLAWSPDSQFLAYGSGYYDNIVRIWRSSDGMLLRHMTGHTGYVNSVAWSPDGQFLASGSSDGTVRVWDMGTK